MIELIEVFYPNAPDEVAAGDSHQLLLALRKKFPGHTFELSTGSPNFVITVDDPTHTTFVMMKSFCDGFLATCHLWER